MSPEGFQPAAFVFDALPRRLPRLQSDCEADCVVIGAGIAGLSIAYKLLKQGKKVIVIDQGPTIGSGQSARSTAQISYAFDDGFAAGEKLLGTETMQLLIHSQLDAFQEIEKIIMEEGINCDFKKVNGYLFDAINHKSRSIDLDNEIEAALRAGVQGVEMRKTVPPLGIGRGIKFPDQAEINLFAYMIGLESSIKRLGGRIYGNIKATSIVRNPVAGYVLDTKQVMILEIGSEPRKIENPGPVIKAKNIILATHKPDAALLKGHTNIDFDQLQWPNRTYAVALPIINGSCAHFMAWDTSNPYFHLRLVSNKQFAIQDGARIGSDYDYIMVGGMDHLDHGTENPENYIRIIDWAKRLLRLNIKPDEVDSAHRWSGVVMEPYDYIGLIGRIPNSNIFMCTGDSGHGILNSVVASILIPDLIFEKHNPAEKIYKLDRTFKNFASRERTQAQQQKYERDSKSSQSIAMPPTGRAQMITPSGVLGPPPNPHLARRRYERKH